MGNKYKEIIDSTDNALLEFIDSVEKLNESAISYMSFFDQHIDNTLYDSSLLKNKMKEIVIRVTDRREK